MNRLRSFQHVLSLLTAIAVLFAFGQAHAAIIINEVSLNNESGDNGEEFFELLSDTGGAEAMTGLTLLIIDGDGGARGSIDRVLDVSSFSTGSNGLFLWRDSALVLSPAPDAATIVNVEDIDPDIENGTATFALVSGFTGLIDDDLDTDDDGTFDVVLPWASVADAVGVMEGGVGSANNVYAASLGGVDIFNADYDPDSIVRLADTGEWIAVDIDEVVSEIPGPYAFDDAQSQREDGTPFTPSTALTFNTLTPGSTNPANIPEPASLALVGLAGLLLSGTIRRRV